MLEKELLLNDLQEQLKNTDNEEVKMMLNDLIYKVSYGQFNVRVW